MQLQIAKDYEFASALGCGECVAIMLEFPHIHFFNIGNGGSKADHCLFKTSK